jgi:ketosteroid isomerase-like protein
VPGNRRGNAVVLFLMRYFCAVHRWDRVGEPCAACRVARPRARQDVLRRAIVAQVSGDVSDLDELYTPDVAGSGPATSARSRQELAIEVEERAAALSQHEVTFGPADAHGEFVRLEWEASALHTGPLVLEGNGAVLEPTGLRLRVRAVTVARFRGERICSWRSHWGDLTLAS